MDLKNIEKFIKKWKKVRQKGKFKFILINGIIFFTFFWAGYIIIYIIDKGKLFHISMEYYSYVLAVFILGILQSRVRWSMNEEKYNDLLNNGFV
jgi:hypothetical protein